MYLRATSIKRGIHHACLLSLLSIIAFSLALPVYAQDDPPQETAVQELTGRAEEGGMALYAMPNLREGDTLHVYLENISGDLDPIVGLSDTEISPAVIDAYMVRVEEAIAEDDDPLRSLPSILDEFFVAWDDDSGPGYAARLEYPVPGDGEYQFLVAPSPARPSTGEFRLLLGINEPQVLSGQAETTGDQIAFLDLEGSQFEVSVQEFTGLLTPEKPEISRDLRRLRAGDILYARVEATAGDLAPGLGLWDYGEKLLSVSNLAGKQPRAGLSWTANEDVEDLRLTVFASTDGGSPAEGEYRLLVGINEPDVLTGAAQANDQTVLKQPIDVKVGVTLHQITDVDQVSENFGAVAALRMEWQDPELAFSPDSCQCSEMVFTGVDFEKYVISKGAEWPQHAYSNQQGNRWTQNRNAVVHPDGRVVYYERFTTDFQAPDFNFTSFPFDTQQLYIRVESLFHVDTFTFSAPESMSGIGEQLGEEEWYVVDSNLETNTQEMRDTFALGFKVKRHVNFYVFRIIGPIILVIIVSWFTFFLKDYGKRVDVASANLLVFVAFNFTISAELPRLGYLTFMDAVLIGTFAISAVVVVVNVVLKRLETAGREHLAERIDKPLIWIYPLLYAAVGLIAAIVLL